MKTDFEYEFELEGLYLEQDPLLFFFDKHDLLERMNKDGYTNNNGNKLIELCKMSDLKIANGRMGKDRGIGNYTCHTTNGNSTIDFAILSMELFPYVDDFYVDILDKCMSDVHFPICLVMICKPTVSIKNDNFMHTARIYEMDQRIICKWKPELDNQYLSSFNMRNIQKFQQQLAAIISNMSHATQELIDHLYINMKSIFIEPANSTGIYREYANNSRSVGNQSRRHGKKVWFNRECELLLKDCMTIKNSLKHVCNPQYQLFHEHVKQYKNIVSKRKKIYTRKFHSNIQKLKTKNPREFWNVIKTETNTKQSQFNDTLFVEFVDHFRELNSDPLFSGTVPLLYDPAITQEVKLAIRKLKNNKASGVDNVINEFFKHCHIDCIQIIVDFLTLY